MTSKNHSKMRIGSQLLIICAFTVLMAIISFNAHADSEQKQVDKEWTFLLFLNGHNNLDSFGAMNMNQMEEIGSSDKVNLVVQWASLANKDTKRILIAKDSDLKNVTSPVVEKLAPVDMGDYKELIKFIEWGVQNYPAKKYFIAVWNHGSGWHRLKNGMSRDISNDDISGNVITTEQLGIAMNAAASIVGKKIDLYGSDACLMAMAEVAAEMKDSVSIFAGSQDLEPGEGWPYSSFIKRLVNKPAMDGAELGSVLTEEYIKAYNGGIYGKESVTFSAYDLSKYSELTKSISGLSKMIASFSTAQMEPLVRAAKSTQAFYYSDYRDMSDFLQQLQKQNVAINNTTLSNLNTAVNKFVVANGATGSFAKAKGLSVWMPTSAYSLNLYANRYDKLVFNQDTNWLSVLKRINP